MKRIFTISVLVLLMISMFIPGGMDLVGETQAAASVDVILTSNPVFWLDANKCNAEGPRGAWMSFIIKNTSVPAQTLTNVTITFNGFTGANAGKYVNPKDPVRLYHKIEGGEEVPAFFYVDYSAVCGGILVGNLSNYSVTVDSPTLAAPVDYNDTVSTDTLITALAAGVLNSTAIGPGIWVGQLLKQTVVFDYGNNKGLFFQPAGQAVFSESSYRLVRTEVTNPINITLVDDPNNRLFFPDATVSPSGQLTVDFYWEVIRPSIIQNVNPWAAAQSGQKFKYTGFGAVQQFPVPKENPISIAKTVQPAYLPAPDSPGYGDVPGQVLYTVTFTNNTLSPESPEGVDVLLYEIYDILQVAPGTIDGCLQIINATVYDDGVDEVLDPVRDPTNTYEVDDESIPGQVTWVGLIPSTLSTPLVNTYFVPARGTFILKFLADARGCEDNTTHINEAWGTYGGSEGARIETAHVKAALQIGTPTAVNISDLSATFDPATMSTKLAWETVSDEAFVGFNVMRSESETGPQVQLNPSIIQVDQIGSIGGALYSFTDNQVELGKTYYYWISVIGRDGDTTSFGPVSVTIGYKTYIPLLVR